MKIIFLDIDGVLNRIGVANRTTTSWKGYIGTEPELVKRFNELCQRTKAKVVLSSTWRLDEDWRETMRANGLTCEFLDRTPSLQPYIERGEEIDYWICEYLRDVQNSIRRYAIIDDGTDFYPTQPLFRTNLEDGLTAELADKITAYMNA